MNDETPQTNGINTEAALDFVRRIEAVQAEIDETMERARAECQPLRDDIAALKREAADEVIGKKALSAVLKRRRLQRHAALADRNLDIDRRAAYEQLIEALERVAEQIGPLGEAALASARAGA